MSSCTLTNTHFCACVTEVWENWVWTRDSSSSYSPSSSPLSSLLPPALPSSPPPHTPHSFPPPLTPSHLLLLPLPFPSPPPLLWFFSFLPPTPQQTIMVENANLRAEIRKLRVENSDLLRRVRFADTNAHYMRVSAKLQVGPRLINTPALVSGPLSSPSLPVWSTYHIHRQDKGYSVSSSIFVMRHKACSVKMSPWTCSASFQRCNCREWFIKLSNTM